MIMANLKCNIITLNVRGIRNRVKRRSIFSYLKDQNCQKTNVYGKMNGEVTFSSRMDQIMPKVFIFL